MPNDKGACPRDSQTFPAEKNGSAPARGPQLAERRVQRIQAGIGHDLVHP
jgi:hypothetical protein